MEAVILDSEGRAVVKKKMSKGQKKVKKVIREYKHGKLHSGSKKGAVVRKKSQALAIAMSEAGLSKKRGRK